MIKPVAVSYPMLYFGLRVFRQRALMPILGFIAGSAVFIALTYCFFPNSFGQMFESSKSLLCFHLTPTLGTLFYPACIARLCEIRAVIFSLGILPVVYFAFAIQGPPRVILLERVVPLGLLCSPYAWTHEWVVLIPGLLCMLLRSTALSIKQLFLTSAVLIAANTILFLRPLAMEQHLWYPATLMLISFWIDETARRTSAADH